MLGASDEDTHETHNDPVLRSLEHVRREGANRGAGEKLGIRVGDGPLLFGPGLFTETSASLARQPETTGARTDARRGRNLRFNANLRILRRHSASAGALAAG